jgi:hypothetical protein
MHIRGHPPLNTSLKSRYVISVMAKLLYLIVKGLQNKHKPILNRANELSLPRDTLGIAIFLPYSVFGVWEWEIDSLKENTIRNYISVTFPRNSNSALLDFW